MDYKIKSTADEKIVTTLNQGPWYWTLNGLMFSVYRLRIYKEVIPWIISTEMNLMILILLKCSTQSYSVDSL